MQVGIVGFSGTGKTTFFNTLTGQSIETGFGGSRSVNTGVIDVPDERIDTLTRMVSPKKTIYAKITFTDVPGNAGTGGALTTQTLEELRRMDALALVLRGFESAMTADPPDPGAELDLFESELRLNDQMIVEKRLERMKKEKGSEMEQKVLERALTHLEDDQSLRDLELSEQDLGHISGYRFLSLKPMIVVLNVADDQLGSEQTNAQLAEIEQRGLTAFPISAALEEEIAELEPEEQEVFLTDLGLEDTARDRFIRAAYGMLDLISFLTQGPDEVRAWTIKRGTNARRAARAIHSDLERGFIRAEVITYDDFVELGSEAACKDAGKARLEGKDYIVLDGDVMHIRANV